jgi:hypothetical protein
MGGSTSKINQLATVINKQTLDVSTSSQFNAHIEINNTARIVASGGATINGVNIRQFAKANLSVLKSESNNHNFISALQNKIKAAIDTKKSDFGIANEDMTNVNTIIDNSIELEYSTEKLTTLDSKINQEAVVIARDEGTSISNAKMNQQADAFMKFVDEASTTLATSIIAATDVDSSIKKVSTNPISDVIDSTGAAIAGVVGNLFDGLGGILGLDTSTVIMLIIMSIVAAIVAGIGGYFYLQHMKKKKGGMPTNSKHVSAPDNDSVKFGGMSSAGLPPIGKY